MSLRLVGRNIRPTSIRFLPKITTANRLLHVRSVSVLSGIGKLAGRTAGRGALGLGVGAGALTWAEWKIDGKFNLKQ